MARNKYWFVFPAAMVLLSFVIANLPMQLASVVAIPNGNFPGQVSLDDPPEPPESAGWPRVFYQRHDHPEPAVAYVWWSMLSLWWNVATAFLVAIACGLLFYLLNRKRSITRKSKESASDKSAPIADTHPVNTEPSMSREDGKKSSPKPSTWRWMRTTKLRLQISDLLLLTLFAALPLGYFQVQKRYAAEDASRVIQLGRDAYTVREAIVPKRMYDWTPHWLKPTILNALLRTTQVQLSSPTSEQVSTVLAMPHLRVLKLGGGEYDLTQLRALSKHHGLSSLQISGRPLDNATLQHISELQNLRALSLDRTNVTAETIELLFDQSPERADRLVTLSLVDSAVDIGGLDQSKILPRFRSLTTLRLPRPLPGTANTFRCSSLPKLRQLAVYSLDRGLNEQVLHLGISDCPKLEVLSLDQLQKISLELRHLPQLSELDLVAHKADLRIEAGQSVPGSLWLDCVEMVDVPKWESLEFYAADINKLSFKQTPKLQSLRPRVIHRVVSGRRQNDEAIPAKSANAIIQGIAESDGPKTVGFSGVPLGRGEIDLQPMLQNPKLANLYLHNCELQPADFKKLSSAPHLQELSSHGCELNGKQVAELLTRFPSLQRWYAATYQIDRLRIEDHEQIRGMIERLPTEKGAQQAHLPICDALQLVSLPEWNVPIRLDHPQLGHLVIQNLPNLQELVVNCPLPKGTVLSGLSNLLSISAGGENLTDEVIADWQQYEQLESFRLYHTGISSEGFQRLLQDKHVRFLDVIGNQLDEVAILGLHPAKLTVVQLDGSKLSPAAVDHLLTAMNLQSLRLWNIKLPAETAKRIIERHDTLQELQVDVTGLLPQQIADLSKGGRMQRLGLQNVNLDASLVKAMLSKNQSFRQFVLIDAQVDPKALITLLRSRPRLTIQLVRTTIPAVMEGDLFASGKLVKEFPKASHLVRYRGADGLEIPVDFNQPRTVKNQLIMTASQAKAMFSMQTEPYAPMAEHVFRSISRDRFEPASEEIAFPGSNPSDKGNLQSDVD